MAGRRGLTFDEIGYWSEVKLAIVKEYAAAYSNIRLFRRICGRVTCERTRSDGARDEARIA